MHFWGSMPNLARASKIPTWPILRMSKWPRGFNTQFGVWKWPLYPFFGLDLYLGSIPILHMSIREELLKSEAVVNPPPHWQQPHNKHAWTVMKWPCLGCALKPYEICIFGSRSLFGFWPPRGVYTYTIYAYSGVDPQKWSPTGGLCTWMTTCLDLGLHTTTLFSFGLGYGGTVLDTRSVLHSLSGTEPCLSLWWRG